MVDIFLRNEDCIKAMNKMEENSVDLLITDPPYNLGNFMKNRDTNLAKMRDNFFGAAGWDDMEYSEWLASMDTFFNGASKVMKKGGSVIVFMSILKVSAIVEIAEKYGFYYKTTGIWHKTNPMPRNMNLHFVNSTEAWIYFVYKTRTGKFNNNGLVVHDFIETSVAPAKERTYGKHPTQKPESLIERFVELLSDEGDVVFDPFMGSGTTGVVCKRMGRNFIGTDIEKNYYDMAQERILGIKRYRAIDLFSGVGGLSLGFEKNGFDVVLAIEYDKAIADAYRKNHTSTVMLDRDIREINFEEVFSRYANTIDVIIGGPPCQGFSQKGKRKTINDDRNFLFKYFLKAVEVVQPKYFLMENVPNLLTAENGYFRNEITALFKELGYSVNTAVLNAVDYGVPQSRCRAFILGKKDGNAPDLPLVNSDKVTVWDAISDLAYLESGEGDDVQQYKYSPMNEYQKLLRENSVLLHNHVATKHSQLVLERLSLIPPNSGKEMLPPEHLTKSIYSGTWTRLKKNEASVTITTRFDTPSSGKFTHPFLNRALTIREAARIQSFPDTYVFYGNRGSQMKQVGNAVPPLLAGAIAKVILEDLQKDR